MFHRQNLLFLSAVLLPSVLVIALGVRTIRQEEELADKRLREQRQQALDLVLQEVFTRLEAILLRAAQGKVPVGDPDIALVARLEAGRIVLPWEGLTSKAEPYLSQLVDSAKAMALLRLDPSAADEYGVPVAVYAARRLVREPSIRRGEIDERMTAVLRAAQLSPAAAHMIAEVCGDGPIRRLADVRAADAELAERLSREPHAFDAGGGWRFFQPARWLVGVTGETVVAARAQRVMDSVHMPAQLRWNTTGDLQGNALSDRLPGLRVLTLPSEGTYSGSSRIFFLSGLLLAILVTLFTAYLLHRDVLRETRLAALRAQFVSSVSHELRTPIASIRAFAELLDMGRVRDEKDRAEFVKNILGESERLSRLVDGVLEFSRMEQGKRVYRLKPISLEEVLQSAAQALAYPLAQGKFELKIAAEPNLPPVSADREALEQAVVNLLGNAIKYSGDGRLIELTLHRDGKQAVILVRDHGIGIPFDEQPRIFERFYRAPDPSGRQIPGTGLGLALVDHIVKAHGGSVAVESQPGQGSTFSILLPLSTIT
ncbi:MAG: hypothetical protein HY820_37775 [Acidobacteria bacterium]|nr:hypothetical protein [Acidobacteriota bacterium]